MNKNENENENQVKLFCKTHNLTYASIEDSKECKKISNLLSNSILFEPESSVEIFYVGVYYAHEVKDRKQAVEWYEKAAALGHSTAMNNLGWYYQYEVKDMKQAVEWFQKAAALGHSTAMINLSCYYQYEVKDMKKAVELYEKSAALGNAVAMNHLGWHYQHEVKDMKQAVEWYKKSAALGNSAAMYNSGCYYQDELEDMKQAVEWYKKSAALGDVDAMFKLGGYYQQQKQFLKAFEYFKKSGEQGLQSLNNLMKDPGMIGIVSEMQYENIQLKKKLISFEQQITELRLSPDPGPDFLQAQSSFLQTCDLQTSSQTLSSQKKI